MKTNLLTSVIISALIVAVPFSASKKRKIPQTEFHPIKEAEKAEKPEIAEAESADAETYVSVLVDDDIRVMDMAQYLIGVVAAEMPANFEYEALKAQAVAARTYTMYRSSVMPTDNHPEADVCNDPACCKAYADVDTLRTGWGDKYDENLEKIRNAVISTDGIFIAYEDEPILAAFHSSSSEYTASSQEVWGGELPYLVSVDSPENSDNVPGFISEVAISPDDFAETVLTYYPEADFSGTPESWIGDAEYSQSGRLLNIELGGVDVKGTELRSMFALRSAALSVECDENIVITAHGYGHGVGMSQYGANVMALDGCGFEDILAHYYPNTVLKQI